MPSVSARCASSVAYSPGMEISATLASGARAASAAGPRPTPSLRLGGRATAPARRRRAAVSGALDGDHDVGRTGVAVDAERRRASRFAGVPIATSARPCSRRSLRDPHQPDAVDVAVADDAHRPAHARHRDRRRAATHVPSSPVDRGDELLGVGDQRAPAGLLDEARRGLHLRAHAAGREVAVARGRASTSSTVSEASAALPAGAEVQRDLRDTGQQHEHVGADVDREALRAAVLVDHAGDADRPRRRARPRPGCRRRRRRSRPCRCSSSATDVAPRRRPSSGIRARDDAAPAAAGVGRDVPARAPAPGAAPPASS